jgi:hypothetical protein
MDPQVKLVGDERGWVNFFGTRASVAALRCARVGSIAKSFGISVAYGTLTSLPTIKMG